MRDLAVVISVVVVVSTALVSTDGAAASPDAGTIAFVRLTDGHWQVWTRDMQDGAETQWTTSARDKRYPVWGAGGSLFHRTNNLELFRQAGPGTEEQPLLREHWPLQDAALSADHRSIAFVRMGSDDPDRTSLWRVDVETGTSSLLVPPAAGRLRLQPTWLGGTAAIAFMESGADEGARLVSVPIAGGPPSPISEPAPFVAHPAASPDGAHLCYAASVEGDVELWVVPVTGGDALRLTESPGLDTQPSWSADGERIAFVTSRSGQLEIWTLRRDGAEPRLAVGGTAPVRDPAWQ